jgi:preprotein translocase subunit SecG
MYTFVLVVHVLVAVSLVGLVLIQQGKGATAGAGFGGGGSSGTVFGARGAASFLSKLTAGLAAAFFATSLVLAYFGAQVTTQTSLIEQSVEVDAVESSDSDVPALPEDASVAPAAGEGTEIPAASSEVPTAPAE